MSKGKLVLIVVLVLAGIGGILSAFEEPEVPAPSVTTSTTLSPGEQMLADETRCDVLQRQLDGDLEDLEERPDGMGPEDVERTERRVSIVEDRMAELDC